MPASSSFALDVVRSIGSRLDDAQPTADVSIQQDIGDRKGVSKFDLSVDLDLAQAYKLPDRKSLLEALEALKSRLTLLGGPASTSPFQSFQDAQALARISYLAHALLLDDLMKEAEIVGDQELFWAEVEDELWPRTKYLIQTLPGRIVNLVQESARVVYTNAQQLNRTPSEEQVKHTVNSLLDGQTLKEVYHLIRTSPNFVVGCTFPSSLQHTHEEPSDAQSTGPQQLQKEPVLKLSLLRPGALSPLRLTRHEAKHKRKQLRKRRNELAGKIGGLALALDRGRTSTKEGSEYPERCLEDIARLHSTVHSLESSSHAKVDLEQQIRTLLQDTLPHHETQAVLRTTLAASPVGLGPPSTLARLWPTFVMVPTAVFVGYRIFANKREAIVESLRNAKETVRGFLFGWVYEPTMRLLETVRHGEADGAMIISRESLNSDLQSLERMVTDFSREKYELTNAELQVIAAKVKEGDLTHVLRIYEEELKSPLKSAVKGSLVRALLIQIQKAKVDLEVAMSGIDSLLKSQQLLFGAVGVAPAMGVLYLTTTWLRNKLTNAADRRGRAAGYDIKIRAWEAMRRIDKLLAAVPNTNKGESASALNAKDYGLLLLDLMLLRSAAEPLISGAASVSRRKGVRKNLRANFLEDVRELEGIQRGLNEDDRMASVADVGLAWHSRRATLDRMWKSFGPLFALHA